MNRLLAGTVGFLNGLLAIILVVAGAVAGSVSIRVAGFVLGGILGLIAAAIICGFLALVIDIRSELVRIREVLEQSNARSG